MKARAFSQAARVGINENDIFYKFDISGLNDVERKNLGTLWTRNSGEKLILDNPESKELRSMTLWEKAKYRLAGMGIMKNTDLANWKREVDLGIDRAITDLTHHISSEDVTAKLKEGEGSKDSLITQLFTEKLAPLSRNVYKRDISDYTFKVLEKSVIKPGEKEPEGAAFKAAKVYASIGNISGAGAGTDAFVVWGKEEGKEVRLGIFKDPKSDPYHSENRKTVAKIRYVTKGFLNKISGGKLYKIAFDTAAGQSYIAEAAASVVSKHVGKAITSYIDTLPQNTPEEIEKVEQLRATLTEMVPDTQITELKIPHEEVKRGSFQLWVNPKKGDVMEGHKFLGSSKRYGKSWKELLTSPFAKKKRREIPEEAFDLLTILDAIMGQSDRHGANFLVVVKGKDKENLNAVKLNLIDNGWAFSPNHPSSQISPRLAKQYTFLSLLQADRDFSDLGKAVIEYMSKPEHLEVMMEELETLYANEEKLINEKRAKQGKKPIYLKAPARLARVRERINILQIHKDLEISTLLHARRRGRIDKKIKSHQEKRKLRIS